MGYWDAPQSLHFPKDQYGYIHDTKNDFRDAQILLFSNVEMALNIDAQWCLGIGPQRVVEAMTLPLKIGKHLTS